MNTAIIKIWDMKVGAIAWDEINQIARFEYYPEFVRTKIELSPIKMPLPTGKRVFEFPELRKSKNDEFDTFKGLPGLLADSLPDRYGNQLINSWLAQNGRPADSMNPVEQLCFIGSRGMGALEFEPAQFRSSKNTSHIEIDSLVNIARKMLSKRVNFTANLKEDEIGAMKEILKIGTSAGGARPKAIIAYNANTGEVRSGQTKSPRGFEHWLIKLDGVSSTQFGESTGYGRVEMAYYKMARACGIKMMESQLLEENGRAHFMTQRFDRENGNTRHHIQTLCAMQHFNYNQVTIYSYEQLFQTMRKLRLPYNDAVQMFRRMVFNVVASNCDDHTKNFAFRLRENSRWELSPAYDICYAFDPKSIWVSQHALSINGKRKGISYDDLLNIAKSMNVKKAKQIIEDIRSNVAKWRDFADEFKVRSELRDLIYNNLVLKI